MAEVAARSKANASAFIQSLEQPEAQSSAPQDVKGEGFSSDAFPVTLYWNGKWTKSPSKSAFIKEHMGTKMKHPTSKAKKDILVRAYGDDGMMGAAHRVDEFIAQKYIIPDRDTVNRMLAKIGKWEALTETQRKKLRPLYRRLTELRNEYAVQK